MSDTVGVSVRFVPAGLSRDGALRGALILTPVPGAAGAACGQQVRLSQWVSDIEAVLLAGGLEVAIAPVRRVEGSAPRPVPPDAPSWRQARRASGTAAAPKRAAQVTQLNERWETLMGCGGSGFADLADALLPTKASGAERIRSGPDTPLVPDIVRNGRGDMGLLLALERSRSVLERMRDPKNLDVGPAAEIVPNNRPNERLRTRKPEGKARDGELPWYARLAAPLPAEAPTPRAERERTRAERAHQSRQANTLLTGEREAVSHQSVARTLYRNAKTAAEVAAALKGLSGQRTSGLAPGLGAATVAKEPDRLKKALDEARVLHFSATRVTETSADYPAGMEPTEATKPVDDARARYFAIQSQPTLARLFNLVVDVVVPLNPAITPLFGGDAPFEDPLDASTLGCARFVFVAARICNAPHGRMLWTTAKLRAAEDNPNQPTALHFWACTREELDARAIGWSQAEVLAAAIATQIDGLLDLGATRIENGICNPRFDLATLDIPRASEGDLHADAQDGGQGTAVRTMPSGGLLLVDRWRQFQAVAQATDSLARTGLPTPATPVQVVIDAEDLTVGLSLDAGLDTRTGPQWRSLVERRITFGDGADATLYDDAIRTLVPDAGERAALNAAILTLPSRLRSNSSIEWPPEATSKPAATAFVEEVVAQWDGTPLGVDLHGSEVRPPTAGTGNLASTRLLQLSQTHSLPDTGPGLPPRQCFGWGYRVGVRPRLAGGVALPLAVAQRAYETGVEGRFALPRADGVVRSRRVLRHERVEAPVVTTPLGILRRTVPGDPETAIDLVVRGHVNQGQVTPLGPPSTHRVLVPPFVPLVFADRHDVFTPEKLEQHGTARNPELRPRGGLRDVAFDRKNGGTFPVWNFEASSDGALYPDRNDVPVPDGDAVFQPRAPASDTSERRQPYYPDPCADLMVFRLRHPDGRDVDGQSTVVRTRRPGVAYPDVTPVAVQVTPVSTRSGSATQSRLSSRKASVFLDEGEKIHPTNAPGRVEATLVSVRLEPGERFQLDVWCLPIWETLADCFDIVESALLVAQAYGAGPAACLSGNAFCANLATMLNMPLSAVTAGFKPAAPAGPRSVGCGAGQLPLPGPAELDCMAQLMHAGALARVTPELAARLTLHVTHAIDTPLLPPSFDVGARPKLGLRRVDDATRAAMLGCASPPTSPWPVEETIAGAAAVVISGWVGIDRATTQFLEVYARGPSLISGTFDTIGRGRSPDDRARGIWPQDGFRADRPGMAADLPWRSPGAVFGFDVDRDGCVTLPNETARLLRLEDIPHIAPADTMDLIDLLAAQRPGSGSPGRTDIMASARTPGQIADTKARILEFDLIAGSRTAPLIRETDERVIGPGTPDPTRSRHRVAMPSTKTPARVAPMTILPAFRTEYSASGSPDRRTFTADRATRLRVRVKRPWFSSGAGERLAIVLWPPMLFDGVVAAGANGADRGYIVDVGETGTMDLRGFSDFDLGPGGAFVSRWGADPIRPVTGLDGWLMPPSAFRDVPSDMAARRPWTPLAIGADDVEVVYVPRATMPIPVDPGRDASEPATIEVSLLAYRPRFEVDQEHWYFDIAIDPATVFEPFVRLGLARYQANAPRALRMSEPVTEWAQLLPHRKVFVSPLPASDAGHPLKVEVTGAGWAGTDHPAIDKALYGPLMAVVVYRRDGEGVETVATLRSGRPATRERMPQETGPDQVEVAEQTQVLEADSALAPSPATAEGYLWSTTFYLNEDPQMPSDPEVTYSVFVAEIHLMRPASYAQEPFDPAQVPSGEGFQQSGPRFAVRVPIVRRDESGRATMVAKKEGETLFVQDEAW